MFYNKVYISFFIFFISIPIFSQEKGVSIIDSLYNKAEEQFNSGKIDSAVSYINQVLNIQEKSTGKENSDYAKYLQRLVIYKCVLKQIPEALQIENEVLRIREITYGKEHPEYARALHNMALINANIENYSEAVRLEKEAISILGKSLGKEHEDYILALSYLASHCIGGGDMEQAKDCTNELLNILENKYGKEDVRYFNILKAQIMNYVFTKVYNEALKLSSIALEIAEKIFSKKHPDYIAELSRQSSIYSELGETSKAIDLANEVLKYNENLYGRQSDKYISSLESLANIYFKINNYPEVIRISEEILFLQKKLNKEPSHLSLTLRRLAYNAGLMFDYQKAIDYEKRAIALAKESNVLPGNTYYAATYGNLPMYYAELEDFDRAIQIQKEALQVAENKYGRTSSNYTEKLHDLALMYSNIGKDAEAHRLLQGCIEIDKKNNELLEWEPDILAGSFNSLSQSFYRLGNYNKAIQTAEEAIKLIKKSKEEDDSKTIDITLARILSNLAMYYSCLGEYSKAVQLDEEALNIREKLLGNNHPEYAISLNHFAIHHENIGEYQEAINIGTKILAIKERIYGKEHTSYAYGLFNLARFHWELCNYEEALRLTSEANNIFEIKFGKSHPAYQTGLKQISQILFESKDYKSVIPTASETFSLLRNLIQASFRKLTSKERIDFWNKNNQFIQHTLPFFAFYIDSDSLLSVVYDAALLNKSILLNTDTEMRSLILESKDTTIIKTYDTMRQNQLILDKLYQKPTNERYLNIDSLESIINKAEEELINKVTVYGDFTRNINITWKDVRNKLDKQDIAIEFLETPLWNDSIMYMALLLKQGMKVPQMIPLFEKKQLDRIEPKYYYTNPALSQLIWEPLKKELKGIKNVYFAPAGQLHNIAIEYLPSSDSTFIAEHMKFYRLSSTRQLAMTKNKKQMKAAIVYGGLRYDADTTALVTENKKYTNIPRDLNFQLTFQPDSINLRDAAQYLPATKIEAEQIGKTLENTKLKPALYMDLKGTEESFKALSGKNINILHIATHGFYWTESEAKQTKNLDFLIIEDNNQIGYSEDKALTRSGLLLSGANIALKGNPLPEGLEDGILTAKELAGLDLRELDLVVLSACQTGLGEITGDGVFGLQRGFKKAGANTLLMSLWKVDDSATQLLMTQFYKNLLAGKGKFESLRDAQKYVRDYEVEIEMVPDKRWISKAKQKEKQSKTPASKEFRKIKKYKDPFYWAAFILLDAI